jgi:hypothetical protein
MRLLAALLVFGLAIGLTYYFSTQDQRPDRNVEFVEFGEGFERPETEDIEIVEYGSDEQETTESTPVAATCPGIFVATPVAGEEVVFPLQVSGTIHPEGTQPGQWIVYNGGEAGGASVLDQNGNVVSERVSIDTEEWTNLDPKPFSFEIPELTAQPYSTNITLRLRDNNQASPSELETSPCNISLDLEEEYYFSL